MHLSSNKPIVKTLKELKIQKALGNDVIMCPRCEDVGKYETRDYGGSSTWNCEACEVGWEFIWGAWLKKLNMNLPHYCSKCPDHNDYDGSERPTVLCDACWKIWFEAPKRVLHLIQNVDKEGRE